jgi:hypothetical protein
MQIDIPPDPDPLNVGKALRQNRLRRTWVTMNWSELFDAHPILVNFLVNIQ